MSFVKNIASGITFVALALVLANSCHAMTHVDDMPIGQMVDASELAPLFSSTQLGSLFTVNIIPTPNSEKIHPIQLFNSDDRCSFAFKTVDPKLTRGDAFEVSRMKRKIVEADGKKILIVTTEFLRKGTNGSNPEDKIFYKREYDVTNFKFYDEDKYLDGLFRYFHSVTQNKRFNKPYAGQEQLEVGRHS